MHISPQVPYLMGLKIPGMVHRLLDKHRLKREDVAHWVVRALPQIPTLRPS